MIVYRVESIVTGNGFYNHGHGWTGDSETDDLWNNEGVFSHMKLISAAADRGNDPHPTPSFDGIESFEEGHFFGFGTRDQLIDWFTMAGIENITNGPLSDWFEINKYEVDESHVLFGGRQVAFIKNEAIKV